MTASHCRQAYNQHIKPPVSLAGSLQQCQALEVQNWLAVSNTL